jgi:hypothetical protein
MNYRFVNRPKPIPLQEYGEAVAFLGERFSQIEGVKTIYRFGNITTPGISDLDLLVVFKDNARCTLTGFEDLPERYKSVFTHGIMALKESHFAKNNYYTLWTRNSRVTGIACINPIPERDQEADKALRFQTAIEFLVANYIDLKVQQEYGTFKLRSLLQHMKGIWYDLEYLEIKDSPLHAPIIELKNWISDWFHLTPDDTMLSNWIRKWIPEYDRFTAQILSEYPFYLPQMEYYKVAGNQILKPDRKPSFQRKGLLLPPVLSVIGKKYFNLQNKFNQFEFGIPITSRPPHTILAERFEFLKDMKKYNRTYLPGFMTMTTSITSKLI